jgi:hypothetical protein
VISAAQNDCSASHEVDNFCTRLSAYSAFRADSVPPGEPGHSRSVITVAEGHPRACTCGPAVGQPRGFPGLPAPVVGVPAIAVSPRPQPRRLRPAKDPARQPRVPQACLRSWRSTGRLCRGQRLGRHAQAIRGTLTVNAYNGPWSQGRTPRCAC